VGRASLSHLHDVLVDSRPSPDPGMFFLALPLDVDLQRRLDKTHVEISSHDLMRDLAHVQAVTVDLDGQRYWLRTDMVGVGITPSRPSGCACLRPLSTGTIAPRGADQPVVPNSQSASVSH